MYLLALETSTSRGGLALFDEQSLIEQVAFSEGLVHGREANLHIDALLRRHQLRPTDLGALAVSVGPGTYTGIRVGVTLVKTLAFALRLPVISVSSLRVIGANATAAGDHPQGGDGDGGESGDSDFYLAVVLDGKQGALYRALFRYRQEGLQQIVEDGLETLEGITERGLKRFPKGTRFIGAGAELALGRLASQGGQDHYLRGPREWDWPRASVLGFLAFQQYRVGESVFEGKAIHTLEPVYLRASEAERKLSVASRGDARGQASERHGRRRGWR